MTINRGDNWISNVAVQFSSPMQYKLDRCISTYTDLPVQPPVEVEKIWTITKTETAIIITCNNVEVLNFLLTDSVGINCVKLWGGNVVEQILFLSGDSASDLYRGGILSWNLESNIFS